MCVHGKKVWSNRPNIYLVGHKRTKNLIRVIKTLFQLTRFPFNSRVLVKEESRQLELQWFRLVHISPDTRLIQSHSFAVHACIYVSAHSRVRSRQKLREGNLVQTLIQMRVLALKERSDFYRASAHEKEVPERKYNTNVRRLCTLCEARRRTVACSGIAEKSSRTAICRAILNSRMMVSRSRVVTLNIIAG